MTGDSGCGAWPQPLLSCTTSLSIAIFVNVLFSAFRVGAPEQPRKVTDFFFSAKLFRQKIVGKVVRPESVPGRCPASFSKASAKLQTFAVTSKCFCNFFWEKSIPGAQHPANPKVTTTKKINKAKKNHDIHNRPIPPHAQAGPSTGLNLLNIYAHAKNLLVKKKYRTFAYHKRRKTCYWQGFALFFCTAAIPQ